MSKLDWFPFYPSKWLSPGDVRTMTAEERGVYMDLLSYSWERGGIPPAELEEPTMLARTSGVSVRKFRAIWDRIQHKFSTDSRGFRVNDRLEEVRERVRSTARMQSERASKGWEKRKKSSDEECRVNADPQSKIDIDQEIEDIPESDRSAQVECDPIEEQLSVLWGLFEKKDGKQRAYPVLRRALKKHGFGPMRAAIESFVAKHRRERTPRQYIPHPATFLNGYLEDHLHGTNAPPSPEQSLELEILRQEKLTAKGNG